MTRISINGRDWLCDGQPVNRGSPAEGLLMNVRMVNCVFEDEGLEASRRQPDFDTPENTELFLKHLPEYVECGVNVSSCGNMEDGDRLVLYVDSQPVGGPVEDGKFAWVAEDAGVHLLEVLCLSQAGIERRRTCVVDILVEDT